MFDIIDRNYAILINPEKVYKIKRDQVSEEAFREAKKFLIEAGRYYDLTNNQRQEYIIILNSGVSFGI